MHYQETKVGTHQTGKFLTKMSNGGMDLNTNLTDKDVVEEITDWETLLNYKNDENALLLLPVICFVFLLIILGGIGNSIVFYVYKTKSKSTTKGVFISVLAVFDLMNCLIVMPFEIYDLRNQYRFTSGDFCKSMRFVEFSIVLAAGFTLVAVAIDRYMNLCVRTSRILFTPSRAKRACCICVGLSIVFSWPVVMFAGLEPSPVRVDNVTINGFECSSFSDESINARIYLYILNIVFILSLVLMIILYSMIGMKLYHRRRGSFHDGLIFMKDTTDSGKFQNNHSDMNIERCGYAIGKRGIRMKGSTLIFYSVTIVFIIGFLPHLITRVLKITHTAFIEVNKGNSTEVAYNFLIRSYMINSAANPFIYSIIHERFRQEIVRTCRKCVRLFRRN
ncbi:growth hormone secretagogue receptor type 1-like [Saccostrea cucullata]|uniref:growth hormone secretagogue receptor type 1-like n=1 Tax=Saccostrea cuccullata TaxID=36930 RepID=UPI002ED3EC6B